MKKVMALTLAIIIACSLSGTGAAAAAKPLKEEIRETAQYLSEFLGTDVSYADGRAVWLVADSGIDGKQLADSYFASVKAQLESDGMLAASYEYEGEVVKYDEPVYYAYAALAAKAAGLDAKDIGGVDMLQRLEGFGREALLAANPYNLTAILSVYEQFEKDMTIEGMSGDIVKTLAGYCDEQTGAFVLWGDIAYCMTDDNARMLMAIAPYGDVDQVAQVLDKGAQWLSAKKSEQGYLGYGDIAPSSSSTALSMAAFAALGDAEAADEAYLMLAAFKADGGYAPQIGEAVDGAFSTVDALHALEVYEKYQDAVIPVYLWITAAALIAAVIVIIAVINIKKKSKKIEAAK